jgi:deoxyribose-phosphate aldolase
MIEAMTSKLASTTALAAIEHTLLSAAATPAMIEVLCDEARDLRLFGVCVSPVEVGRCRARLSGSEVRVVAVVGFPLANTFNECVRLECQLALEAGADEIDAVMRVSAAKSGNWAQVQREARSVVEAAAGKPVKLILETAYLDAVEIERACATAVDAGVQFVKTSTGYASRGATLEDIEQMRRHVRGRARIKASGGIRTADQALAMLAAGADRIGTSAGAEIARELARRDAAAQR